MMLAVVFACLAGVLVGVSRQVNGRLSLSTSPLVASFWNHLVGLAALTLAGLAMGGLFPPGAGEAPSSSWPREAGWCSASAPSTRRCW